jgi:hypothetical protein
MKSNERDRLLMAAKKKVTVSMSPVGRRPSSAERRAEQNAMLSDKQAQLKREAAERRQKRAARGGGPPAP